MPNGTASEGLSYEDWNLLGRPNVLKMYIWKYVCGNSKHQSM